VADATARSAGGWRPDPQLRGAKRSLARDLIARRIRPGYCASKQPVLLAGGTETKLREREATL